ncbi:hypothetical protein nbrc107696_24830 [Gordonia spumicola]|uniref:Uncharacterized protein n=1 Tax=Gordonia spumicola TaxID=589161 RepID=A0A7I9V9L8_9ACTN|nr:hypothetical protein [Gordonia spumicola]GEE02037.1 hypothetical protein nbrc107696_24830 [Gordonia spumicola]
MEPVEVNAGAWYLRALRDDDRLSDVPALSLLSVDEPADYIAASDADWASESRFVWAICVPTTGEAIALIGVAGTVLSGVCRDGFDEALDAAVGPITRFAAGALDQSVGPLTTAVP